MYTTPPVLLDMEMLKARLRQDAERCRTRALAEAGIPLQSCGERTVNWPQLNVTLTEAGQNADLGAQVPAMEYRKGLKRWLARTTAKWVMYLSKFLTRKQRACNALTLQSLRTLADGVRHLEQRLADRESQLRLLQARLEQLESQRTERRKAS